METKFEFNGATKPSQVVRAMCLGLRNLRENQRIDMTTFGNLGVTDQSVCYGCAATWAIQEMYGDELPMEYFEPDCGQLEGLGTPHEGPIQDLECAIDSLRRGSPSDLLALFCGEEVAAKLLRNCGTIDDLVYLDNSTTQVALEESLAPYEKLAEQLEGKGY